MSARFRGFTLLELLIAMSLFMVLGTALIALVTRAIGFLEVGTGGAELQDKGGDILRPFESDMQNVLVERSLAPGAPEIRFYCDFVAVDSDGNGENDYLAQRLAFVRSSNQEAVDPVARRAGTTPGGAAYLDGKLDAEEAANGELKAVGGAMEVLYMAVPEDAENPGLLTIYRGTRAPVGGAGSLLDPETVKTIADLKRVAQPLMSGVLHFGVKFWTAQTSSWDISMGGLGSGAPSLTWDSTRGILPGGRGTEGFALARGTDSLVDPRDDVSPRKVHVTFVVDRTGRDAKAADLVGGIDDRQRDISVAPSTSFATDSNVDFIKVGTEWVEYSARLDEQFTARQRGARNTTAVSHKNGAKVRAGHTVETVILVPSYREDWNFR